MRKVSRVGPECWLDQVPDPRPGSHTPIQNTCPWRARRFFQAEPCRLQVYTLSPGSLKLGRELLPTLHSLTLQYVKEAHSERLWVLPWSSV